MAILGPLRALDPVAYLRFASVYKSFSSADDFEEEIALLRMEEAAGSPSVELGERASVVEPGERQRARVETRGEQPVAVRTG
jgi:transcriptional repressor NrdR